MPTDRLSPQAGEMPGATAGATAGRVLGERTATRPGPTLIILGAVHGNEPAGVEASKLILQDLGPSGLVRGSVVAMIGNLAAYRASDSNTRYLHSDLNRIFNLSQIRVAEKTPAPRRTPEQAELLLLHDKLREIRSQARGPVYLLDLHTTSATSCPFAVIEDALPSRRLAVSLGLPLVLGLEEELDGVLIDFASDQLGMVSVLVEGGQHAATESVDVLHAAIQVAMDHLGLTERAAASRAQSRRTLRAAAGAQAGAVYDIRHREPVASESTRVPPELRSFGRVRAGVTVIATENGREIRSPETGYVLMPNRQRARRVGDDALFIAERIGPTWLRVSAILRKSDWVHRLLPRVAPGVRHRAGSSRELLVAPEIAAVFRRELLHLLGYRIVRHAPDPHWHGLKRLAKGTGAALEAVVSMMTGTFTGGEPAALHEERDEDWIVRRRRLDAEPPAEAPE